MQDDVNTFANLDYDRATRCGFPEVVFGLGKTAAQMTAIASSLLERHDLVLITRVQPDEARLILDEIPDGCYLETPRALFIDRREQPVRAATTMEALASVEKSDATGDVVVCCAGTSDLYVAEEAALTACLMGSHVTLVPDIGIAGVHRTLDKIGLLREARVIVCCAGMEGALPSLVAGLVDVPVIAVPTSVGYGANLGGISALLAMVNSCAGGVSVVNIDNGFGAGQIAHRINCPRWLEGGPR